MQSKVFVTSKVRIDIQIVNYNYYFQKKFLFANYSSWIYPISSSIKWLKRLRNDELGKGAYDGYNVINVGPNRYQFLDHERVAKLSIDEYQAELQIKASRVDDAGMYICFVSDSSNQMNSWSYKSVLLKIVPSDLTKGNK